MLTTVGARLHVESHISCWGGIHCGDSSLSSPFSWENLSEATKTSRTPEGLAASRLGGILSYVMYPIFQSVHFLSRSSSGMSCLLNLKRLPLIFHQNTKYVLTRLKCQNKRKMNLSDRGVQTVRGWWRLNSLSRNRKSPLRWSLVLEFLTSDGGEWDVWWKGSPSNGPWKMLDMQSQSPSILFE